MQLPPLRATGGSIGGNIGFEASLHNADEIEKDIRIGDHVVVESRRNYTASHRSCYEKKV